MKLSFMLTGEESTPKFLFMYMYVKRAGRLASQYEIKMKGLKCHWTEINMNSWVSNA